MSSNKENNTNNPEIPKTDKSKMDKLPQAMKVIDSIVSKAKKNVKSKLLIMKNVLSSGLATLFYEFMYRDVAESSLQLLAQRLKVDNYTKVLKELEDGTDTPSSIRFKNFALQCKEETAMRNPEFQNLTGEVATCLNDFKKQMIKHFASAKKLDIKTSKSTQFVENKAKF